jgi:hypothetical protein
MSQYNIYNGIFNCHTCREEVKIVRLYQETGIITWMCKSKHISKVEFYTKRYK